MLRPIISLIALGIVPILLFLAWRGWTKHIRKELPPWRNGLCISVFLLLSLNWLGMAILELPVLVNPQMIRPDGLMVSMLTVSHPFSFIVIVLAFAFRR